VCFHRTTGQPIVWPDQQLGYPSLEGVVDDMPAEEDHPSGGDETPSDEVLTPSDELENGASTMGEPLIIIPRIFISNDSAM
jgi:hypothetical protein